MLLASAKIRNLFGKAPIRDEKIYYYAYINHLPLVYELFTSRENLRSKVLNVHPKVLNVHPKVLNVHPKVWNEDIILHAATTNTCKNKINMAGKENPYQSPQIVPLLSMVGGICQSWSIRILK